MEEELDRAIKVLAARINPAVQPDHALKYTQAALNLAHVKTLLEGKSARPKGGSA